jgi:isoquinoline 1-oxidoreductase beta subunit
MTVSHTLDRAAGSAQSELASSLSRRRFLRTAAATGGGLMLGLRLPLAGRAAAAADGDDFVPNAFIRIGADGQVVLTMPYVEMGQGTYTSIRRSLEERG